MAANFVILYKHHFLLHWLNFFDNFFDFVVYQSNRLEAIAFQSLKSTPLEAR